MTAPVKPYRKPEAKTIAAPIGGGLGGALVPFIIWLLGVYVWDATRDAKNAIAAAAAVPPPITGMITFVVPAALALAAAYWAPQAHRPDLADETLPVIQPVASPDEERIATSLEHLDATLGQMHDNMQHTGPILRPDLGLAILGDEAHD